MSNRAETQDNHFGPNCLIISSSSLPPPHPRWAKEKEKEHRKTRRAPPVGFDPGTSCNAALLVPGVLVGPAEPSSSPGRRLGNSPHPSGLGTGVSSLEVEALQHAQPPGYVDRAGQKSRTSSRNAGACPGRVSARSAANSTRVFLTLTVSAARLGKPMFGVQHRLGSRFEPYTFS